MPIEAVEPWLDLPNVTYYSLQKGDAAKEARGRKIVELPDDVHDFADTAAIIANLDLIVSVDTSVAHVAAAMGKPVWVLSRLDACWRWLRNRPDSPWYPTIRLFRQRKFGDWADVFERIALEIRHLFV